MALLDYTTYEDVRALIGVSSDELEDATLGLEVYETYLISEFEEIGENLVSDFETVAMVSEATRTTQQKRFYRMTRLFASYATAKQLTASLPMFGPKDISDGKATVSRFAASPYKDVVKGIAQEYDRIKGLLSDAYLALTSASSTTTVRSYLGSTGLSVDPVTGS